MPPACPWDPYAPRYSRAQHRIACPWSARDPAPLSFFSPGFSAFPLPLRRLPSPAAIQGRDKRKKERKRRRVVRTPRSSLAELLHHRVAGPWSARDPAPLSFFSPGFSVSSLSLRRLPSPRAIRETTKKATRSAGQSPRLSMEPPRPLAPNAPGLPVGSLRSPLPAAAKADAGPPRAR